ncbi:hypothetical protein BT96DRAFT_949760 [Gymnopus androsaceus JB14]|uniref:Uncharacterized protein n=1 Tax=Gymnopus androsaceus JB14 TaxID=1447944 RepID=A0A6A4GJU3_9AGAR|nr:hypothetical protein BT96DRAFT_949760 [Gymnopus androsaceus JB14]
MAYQTLDILPSSPQSDSDTLIDNCPLSDTDSITNTNGNSTMSDESPSTTGTAQQSSDDSGTEDQPALLQASLPYSGIPNGLHLVCLEGRDNDGWDNHHGDPCDWYMNINSSWGSPLDTQTGHPLVNLRSDFCSLGLTWEDSPNHDTSLDHLCNEEWAEIQCKSLGQATQHPLDLTSLKCIEPQSLREVWNQESPHSRECRFSNVTGRLRRRVLNIPKISRKWMGEWRYFTSN